MFLSHVKMKINQRDIYILLRLNLLFYWRKTWDFHSTATDLWGLRGSFPLLLPPIPPCLAVTRAWKAQVTTISGFSWWKSSRWKKKKKMLFFWCFPLSASCLWSKTFSSNNWNMTSLPLLLPLYNPKWSFFVLLYLFSYMPTSHCV